MTEPVQQKRPWAVSEIVSWMVIVVAVAIVMWSVTRKHAADADAAADAGEMHEPKMQSVLGARYAVGVNQLMKSGGPALGSGGKASVDQLLDALERDAKRPEDRLRASIVRGELQGPEQARQKLHAIADAPADLEEDVATLERLYAGDTLPPEDLTGLRQRHGWFADLAAAHGKPDSDPDRAAVLNAGLRTLSGIVAIMALAAVAGLAGCVLIIVAILLFNTGKLRPSFGKTVPLPHDRRAYLQGFTMFLSCYVGGSLILRMLLLSRWEPSDLVSAAIGLAVLFLAVAAGLLWPLFRGQRWRDWKAATGFHLGRGLIREIFSGWLGYITGFPVLVAGLLVTIMLVRLTNNDASHPIVRELGGGPASWIAVFLLASVWAPITEELMFRGMLFASLRERFGWWISAPIVALVFAAIHPQGWVAVPVLGAIAIVFAGIREWRGSVIGCMAAHALHNGVAVIIAILMLT